MDRNIQCLQCLAGLVKEAEAFASLTGVEIKMNGLGSIYAQSITKGTELKQGTEIELYAK